MKTKDIITYAAIAAGAYGIYWYITHFGPSGAAMDANGNKIAASWWDSLFGGSVTGAGTGAGNGAGTSTVPQAVSVGGVSTDQLLVAASLPATGKLSSSQWNYYYGKISGVEQNAVYLGDNGSPMSVFDYMGLRQSRGYTSPQAGNTSAASPASPAAAHVAASTPVTQDQIAEITALLKTSDVPAFLAMVANGLTSQQAAAMLANAPACQTKVSVPFQPPVVMTSYDLAKNACGGVEAPSTLMVTGRDVPNPTPFGMGGGNGMGAGNGMGVITPTRSEQSTTASPKRSPWGRIASADRAGMSWKN